MADQQRAEPDPPSDDRRAERPRPAGTGLRSPQAEHGVQPGTRYVRIQRLQTDKLRRIRKGILRATERADEPEGGLERVIYRAKRFLFGRRLTTEESHHELLPKRKALAVFASDALSSSAYAPEEILLVLMAAGAAGLTYGVPVAAAVVVLLAIVAFSYTQTIRSYPAGGGTYIVTKDNLGTVPSLVAASALLIGYILTVAVSVAAGVAAITSALPWLVEYKVWLAVGCIGLLSVANLRGVSESGTIFSVPTYAFVASVLATLVLAGIRLATGTIEPSLAAEHATQATELVTPFLIARAFTSGCAALTGTEAIADGVPAFKPPAARNAIITLSIMAVILGTLFFGITVMAGQLGLVPIHGGETLISQVARTVWGEGWVYYFVQAATMLILILAANTAFVDFPRVNYFLARDHFMPHYFQFRGDRLAYSTGIGVLAAVAIALVVAFQADVTALIPLYAIGVFIAFTCSQASMVSRWWTRREPGWHTSLPINIVGTITTGSVAIMAAVTKFEQGAWIVLLLVPALVAMMLAIHHHYAAVEAELALGDEAVELPELGEQVVLVPISNINRAALEAVAYAQSISKNVRAVHVADNRESAQAMRDRWQQLGLKAEFLILESPYRSISGPLLAYIDFLDDEDPDLPITVVLPEFVPRHWWEYLLHNQSALRLRTRLYFRPNTVVVSVPYHLNREPTRQPSA